MNNNQFNNTLNQIEQGRQYSNGIRYQKLIQKYLPIISSKYIEKTFTNSNGKQITGKIPASDYFKMGDAVQQRYDILQYIKQNPTFLKTIQPNVTQDEIDATISYLQNDIDNLKGNNLEASIQKMKDAYGVSNLSDPDFYNYMQTNATPNVYIKNNKLLKILNHSSDFYNAAPGKTVEQTVADQWNAPFSDEWGTTSLKNRIANKAMYARNVDTPVQEYAKKPATLNDIFSAAQLGKDVSNFASGAQRIGSYLNIPFLHQAQESNEQGVPYNPAEDIKAFTDLTKAPIEPLNNIERGGQLLTDLMQWVPGTNEVKYGATLGEKLLPKVANKVRNVPIIGKIASYFSPAQTATMAVETPAKTILQKEVPDIATNMIKNRPILSAVSTPARIGALSGISSDLGGPDVTQYYKENEPGTLVGNELGNVGKNALLGGTFGWGANRALSTFFPKAANKLTRKNLQKAYNDYDAYTGLQNDIAKANFDPDVQTSITNNLPPELVSKEAAKNVATNYANMQADSPYEKFAKYNATNNPVEAGTPYFAKPYDVRYNQPAVYPIATTSEKMNAYLGKPNYVMMTPDALRTTDVRQGELSDALSKTFANKAIASKYPYLANRPDIYKNPEIFMSKSNQLSEADKARIAGTIEGNENAELNLNGLPLTTNMQNANINAYLPYLAAENNAAETKNVDAIPTTWVNPIRGYNNRAATVAPTYEAAQGRNTWANPLYAKEKQQIANAGQYPDVTYDPATDTYVLNREDQPAIKSYKTLGKSERPGDVIAAYNKLQQLAGTNIDVPGYTDVTGRHVQELFNPYVPITETEKTLKSQNEAAGKLKENIDKYNAENGSNKSTAKKIASYTLARVPLEFATNADNRYPNAQYYINFEKYVNSLPVGESGLGPIHNFRNKLGKVGSYIPDPIMERAYQYNGPIVNDPYNY